MTPLLKTENHQVIEDLVAEMIDDPDRLCRRSGLEIRLACAGPERAINLSALRLKASKTDADRRPSRLCKGNAFRLDIGIIQPE